MRTLTNDENLIPGCEPNECINVGKKADADEATGKHYCADDSAVVVGKTGGCSCLAGEDETEGSGGNRLSDGWWALAILLFLAL